jgi:NADPH:quinone reductase-like Zn-dependent oxidoreductase
MWLRPLPLPMWTTSGVWVLKQLSTIKESVSKNTQREWLLSLTRWGDTQQRSLQVLKPGGILVSVVSPVSETEQKRHGIRAAYFYVDVTTTRLNKITELFESGKLTTHVGTVLPLEEARKAHEMLGGAPHRRGKIVLSIAA